MEKYTLILHAIASFLPEISKIKKKSFIFAQFSNGNHWLNKSPKNPRVSNNVLKISNKLSSVGNKGHTNLYQSH